MTVIALFAATAAVTGCGGAEDASEDIVDDPGTGQSVDAVTAGASGATTKYHYAPKVEGVTFAGGCGLSPCYETFYGFVLGYTPKYADLHSTIHTTDTPLRCLNGNCPHRLTVTLDTWSHGRKHSHVTPAERQAHLKVSNIAAGADYLVVVRDRHGRKLWSGNVRALHHL